MTPLRHVSDGERRARLAIRHALHPRYRVDSPEAATRAVAVLHATEPATIYLSCWARVDGFQVADLDRALATDRSLIKQLAMRRTLFVFPLDLLGAAWGSASARVAEAEGKRMAKDVVNAELAADGAAWLQGARDAVLAVLEGHPGGRTALELREDVPALATKIVVSSTAIWSGPRVLTHLGATGHIVRGASTTHWRTSRPRWTRTSDWLGDDVPEPGSSADGYRELIRRWLAAFGPGTEDDLVWWLGGTKGVVRTALAELDAVQVSLDGGGIGWLLPDDTDEVADPGPWAALLPVLDPTVMGWKERAFSLGPHRDQIFDRNGNAGTTVLVDGRIVGCWTQDEDGRVLVHLLEPVTAAAQSMLDAEAARLTAWLDGVVVGTVYRSPAMRAADAARLAN